MVEIPNRKKKPGFILDAPGFPNPTCGKRVLWTEGSYLDGDEVGVRVVGNRLGHEGLAAARRAVEEHPHSDVEPHGHEPLRVGDWLRDGEGQLLPHLDQSKRTQRSIYSEGDGTRARRALPGQNTHHDVLARDVGPTLSYTPA